MYDQEGDALRGRKTVPLVVGDAKARWLIAVPMLVCCWLCPWLWASSPSRYVAPVAPGLLVVVRSLTRRSQSEDKNTFRIWNLWLVLLYMLPILKAYSNLGGPRSLCLGYCADDWAHSTPERHYQGNHRDEGVEVLLYPAVWTVRG